MEPAIAAAALTPHECYYKGDRLDQFPGQIARDLRRGMEERAFRRYIAGLRENLIAHRGLFAYLSRVTPDRTPAGLQLLHSLA